MCGFVLVTECVATVCVSCVCVCVCVCVPVPVVSVSQCVCVCVCVCAYVSACVPRVRVCVFNSSFIPCVKFGSLPYVPL